MSSAMPDARFLDPFGAYLATLGQDARAIGAVVARGGRGASERHLVAGLNYVFKSLDLIPDGIDDLGFLDDAFVLRVAASLAAGASVSDETRADDETLARLAREAGDVREFLEADYARLEAYVRDLGGSVARGRTADDVLGDDAVRETFVREVDAWACEYETPSFKRDVKTLVKLRAFLGAKLPG